jgi:tetratricopeptide (TPR) repeat protein
LLIWVATSIFLVAPANAASRTKHQAKERQARAACLSGDYQKGVSILAQLFVVSKDPTYLFNQGRCFEQNRRYEDAIARFQEYLRAAKDVEPAGREEANKHIADCEALLGRPKGEGAAVAPVPVVAPPAPPAPVAPPVAAAPPPTPASVEAVAQPASEPQRSSGSGLRTAGVITAATGGVALVAAVLLNLKVNGMTDDLHQPDGYTDAKESSRKDYKTAASISYGLGAACVAAGAVLYILGWKSHGSSASVALAPALGPGQAGAVIEGSF